LPTVDTKANGKAGSKRPSDTPWRPSQRSDANTRGYWLPQGQELTEEQIKTFRGHRGFVVIKKRWIVERSFAWLSFDRRLNREYDLLPETTEAFIQLSFIRRMIRRLAAFAQKNAVSA
jgi:transposase